jgi:hypothetical protein
LVEHNNGVFGWWCMGFHPDGVGNGTPAKAIGAKASPPQRSPERSI